MVEDLLAVHGVIVSHQTVRLWAEKFGRRFANDIRKRSAGKLGDKWHIDEVVITIGGKKHWLWRAVDHDGFVLDARVQSRRNARAAKRFLFLQDDLRMQFELAAKRNRLSVECVMANIGLGRFCHKRMTSEGPSRGEVSFGT